MNYEEFRDGYENIIKAWNNGESSNDIYHMIIYIYIGQKMLKRNLVHIIYIMMI